MSETHVPTARTRVVRETHRGVYERAAAYEILDEGFICHVGFVIDGQPFVIPTAYGRSGDNLYIHGSAASRMLRNLDKGIAACITVTLLEGLVLARSIFNHSMNYRSVVVLGTAVAVLDAKEKLEALKLLSEHILAGRWAESRQPNEKELKQTLVLRLGNPSRNGPRSADQRSAAGPEDSRAALRASIFAQAGESSLIFGRWQNFSQGFHGFARIKILLSSVPLSR
jgi:uncharacterized protein